MDYFKLSVDELKQELSKIPVRGAVPMELQRAVHFMFNSAIDDQMSGDSGYIMHSPGHAYDLLKAVQYVDYQKSLPYPLASIVKYQGRLYLIQQNIGGRYALIGHSALDSRGYGNAWRKRDELELISLPDELSWSWWMDTYDEDSPDYRYAREGEEE